MNLLFILMFLISACESKCLNDENFTGFIVVYDEYYCPSCLKEAKEYLEELSESEELEYILYAKNSISKKKILIEFDGFEPISIYLKNHLQAKCLNAFPNVSFLYKDDNTIKILKDFTE